MSSLSREHRAAVAVARRQQGMITSEQARVAGLSRSQVWRLLQAGAWTPLSRGSYLVSAALDDGSFDGGPFDGGPFDGGPFDGGAARWGGQPVDPLWGARVRAALTTRRDAVLCDVTAARLHGFRALPLPDPAEPVHLMTPGGSGRAGPGVVVHRSDPSRTVLARRLPVTSVDRTIADLVLAWPRVEAVMLMDDALHQRKVATLALARQLTAGRRGCRDRRPWWDLADGRSESPLETRFRLLLADHGIVPDELQYPVADPAVGFVARLDFAWPERRVCVEVDGRSAHEGLKPLHGDRKRQNVLVRLGWTVLRFTYIDIVSRPTHVAHMVAAAIATPR